MSYTGTDIHYDVRRGPLDVTIHEAVLTAGIRTASTCSPRYIDSLIIILTF